MLFPPWAIKKKAEDTSVHVLLGCLSSFLLFEFRKEKLLDHREGICVTLQKSTARFGRVAYCFTPVPSVYPRRPCIKIMLPCSYVHPEGKVKFVIDWLTRGVVKETRRPPSLKSKQEAVLRDNLVLLKQVASQSQAAKRTDTDALKSSKKDSVGTLVNP